MINKFVGPYVEYIGEIRTIDGHEVAVFDRSNRMNPSNYYIPEQAGEWDINMEERRFEKIKPNPTNYKILYQYWHYGY